VGSPRHQNRLLLHEHVLARLIGSIDRFRSMTPVRVCARFAIALTLTDWRVR
jgi:hypothetical protein